MIVRSSEQILESNTPRPPYLIHPYIPANSRILLHGKSSHGKSPLGWEIAHCIGDGTPFMGAHQAAKARVLWLELDTPLWSVEERLKARRNGLSRNITWVFGRGLVITNPMSPMRQELVKLAKVSAAWDLVIVNTLRQAHNLDEKSSETAERVYHAFEEVFGAASILLIHHENKVNPDPAMRARADESYAGSRAWANLTQSQLQLVHAGDYPGIEDGMELVLHHHKNQVGERAKPLKMVLLPDGGRANLVAASASRDELVKAAYAQHLSKGLGKPEARKLVGETFGLGRSSIFRILGEIQSNGEDTRWTPDSPDSAGT